MNFATFQTNMTAIKLAAIKKILENEEMIPEINPYDSFDIEVVLRAYVSVNDLIGKEEGK